MEGSLKRKNFPVVGKFPLLVLRKRGPYNLASIIRMADNVEDFIQLLSQFFTQRAILRISTRSKLQSQSLFWFLYKRCIITGTIAKRVIGQNLKGSSNPKLNRCITRLFPGSFKSEAMEYGVRNEKRALDTFYREFKSKHIGPKMHTTGLVLYKKAPFLGGSPDGIISCQCCSESYLIEVKCPFRLKETGLQNWPILEYLDEQQNLRRTHTYFNQLNLYQGILGIRKAFFVIYARDEIIIKLIHFDQIFFDFQVQNLTEYYMKYYLPTVIGTKI